MGTGSFPGVQSGRGVTLTPHPLLVPRSKNRAFVGYKKGETYLPNRLNFCVIFFQYTNKFITQPVLRAHGLLQSQFSTEFDVVLLLSTHSIQWGLGSRTPLFTNNSFHEQIFEQKSLGWRTVSRITNTQAGYSGKLTVSARESVAD
jgi:hypothetical protein